MSTVIMKIATRIAAMINEECHAKKRAKVVAFRDENLNFTQSVIKPKILLSKPLERRAMK
jgi:hypothetical protein